jgi:ribosomal protein S1
MRVPQTFECVKLDKKRGNIVLSRRAVIEKIRNKDKNKITRLT